MYEGGTYLHGAAFKASSELSGIPGAGLRV